MRSPRRILFVQPNAEIGGSDIALLRTIQALDRSQVEPLVVLPKAGPFTAEFEAAGAKILVQPMMQLRTLRSVRYQSRYVARFWPTVFALARLMRSQQPDLIHTNSLYSLYGGFAARLVGRPHLWHVREIPPQIPVLHPSYVRMVYALSNRVVAMTQSVVDGLGHSARRSTKTRILYEGLDLSAWRAPEDRLGLRDEIGVPRDVPLISFVGRLDPWKGAHVFVKAASEVLRRHPQARFIVSGGPPDGFEQYAQSVESTARNLGLGEAMKFLGIRYYGKDIARIMSASDVVCHCSTEPEPFGLVLIEAMALGCAVVGANAGGPREIVTHNVDGLLATPNDAGSFAHHISLLLANPAMRAAMGAAAREKVATRFSPLVFRRNLIAIYDEILPQAQAAPTARASPV